MRSSFILEQVALGAKNGSPDATQFAAASDSFAAAGRRASRGSIRSSTRVNRPACSVLAICRNTAVTIE